MKSNKKKGMVDEKKASKELGGSLVPNSGALWFAKGDIILKKEMFGFNGIMIQNKKTDKKSYTLQERELLTLNDEALVDDKIPVFRIGFESDAYMVIPEWFFKALLELDKCILIE